MSGVARIVGQVAAVVATVAGIVALFIPGGQIFGIALLKIAAIAAAVSAIANVVAVATAKQQKPPDAQGSVNEVLIGSNMPIPYGIGRSYVGGNEVYDDSAGTKNSDRTRIFVGSHAGPIEGFEQALFDFAPVSFATNSGGVISGAASGYYNGFLWADTRLGARPDTALTAVGGRPSFTGRSSASKTSGLASWFFDMMFDTTGERWSSGIPASGMVAKWVKVYDPRADSTYPGGVGAQRWDDESTWTWSENPGLHGLTYARGRFMGPNNIKVVGCGISQAAIDVASFVELANICDANGWTLGGTIYEGSGISKWNNLKLILDAAAAKPAWVGGRLTVQVTAPRTALTTITKDDLADGEIVLPAMRPWKDKFNTIVPLYRSEDHRWEYVQADPVVETTYLAEDGEEKSDQRQYDLITDVDQAAQRAAYDLVNDRELEPIQLPLKRRLRPFRPGEAVAIDWASICDDPDIGTMLAVITGRTPDPRTGGVSLELVSETTAKHAYVLGQVGTPPPTPTIPAAGTSDQDVSDNNAQVDAPSILRASYPKNLDVSAVDAGSNATIHLYGRSGGPGTDFTIDYALPTPLDVIVPHADITGLAYSTTYYLYADVARVGDDAPVYGATTVYADSINSAAHPARIDLKQKVLTPASGAGSTVGGGTGSGYGSGDSTCPDVDRTLVQLANATLDGPGEWRRLRDCRPTVDWAWTRHELTGDYGAFLITGLMQYEAEVWAAPGYPPTTRDHRFRHFPGDWFRMDSVGAPEGTATVGQLTVDRARTFIAAAIPAEGEEPVGVESHNLKNLP